jgi:hypothetical protein
MTGYRHSRRIPPKRCVQRERRRKLRERRLDLIEHRLRRIRAVPYSEEHESRRAADQVDDVGNGVPARRVFGEGQDMVGRWHGITRDDTTLLAIGVASRVSPRQPSCPSDLSLSL